MTSDPTKLLIRRVVVYLVAVIAVSLHGSPFPFASDPGTYNGRTIVKSLGEHCIGVEVDASGPPAAHIFRFWSNEPLPNLDADYEEATVEFYGNELIVVASQAWRVLRFRVGQRQGHPLALPAGFSSSGYAGYGLNHEIRPAGPIFEWPGGGASDCTSGGRGANSCSVSKAGRSCSASCGIGYYACCKSGLAGVSCGCVKK